MRASKRRDPAYQRKVVGIIALASGALSLIFLVLAYGLPNSTTSSHTKSVLSAALLGFLCLFGFLAFVYAVDVGIRLAQWLLRGAGRSSRSGSGAQLADLEQDYAWRRVKVIYIVVAIIVVLACVGGASSSSDPFQPQPDLGGGMAALIIGTLIAWGVYRLALTRLYSYLKRPAINEK
jgi:hypothetical protein